MKKLNGEWGIETQHPDIKGVFSECDQDVWVVETLDEKENGYFLDIGCSVPWMWNNTALLEANYGWRGIAIDQSFENNVYVPLSKERGIEHDWKSRPNTICVEKSALEIDYEKLLDEHNAPAVIDFLSVDIEPSEKILEVFEMLPHDKYKFRTVAFEHNDWLEGSEWVEHTRKVIASYGYTYVKTSMQDDYYIMEGID